MTDPENNSTDTDQPIGGPVPRKRGGAWVLVLAVLLIAPALLFLTGGITLGMNTEYAEQCPDSGEALNAAITSTGISTAPAQSLYLLGSKNASENSYVKSAGYCSLDYAVVPLGDGDRSPKGLASVLIANGWNVISPASAETGPEPLEASKSIDGTVWVATIPDQGSSFTLRPKETKNAE